MIFRLVIEKITYAYEEIEAADLAEAEAIAYEEASGYDYGTVSPEYHLAGEWNE